MIVVSGRIPGTAVAHHALSQLLLTGSGRIFLAASLGSICIFRWLRSAARRAALSRIANERGARAAKEIREFSEQMHTMMLAEGASDQIKAVLSGRFKQIQQCLQDRRTSCVNVTRGVVGCAYAAHQQVNCLVSFIPSSAALARSLDQMASPKGPLHGVPISVKENINVAGHDITAGVAKLCNVPCSTTAAVVQALVDAGAVPFCRTNIPQTMLSYGCSNPIFGCTRNPHDTDRTSGGSSGGEAALIASGGSLLGIGTDVGGSVRLPAAFCGVVGFKPTSSRVTRMGIFPPSGQMTGVASCPGVMGRDVGAIEECLRVLYSPYLWRLDPSIPPLPFDDAQLNCKEPLRIGFYVTDGFIDATPPCARAVEMAVRALEATGHKVVRFEPPCVPHGMRLFYKLLTADGGVGLARLLEDEKLDVSLEAFAKSLWSSRGFYNRYIRLPFFRLLGWTRYADIEAQLGTCSVQDLWKFQLERIEYLRRFTGAMQEAGIEALVTPQHVMMAPKPNAVASTGMTLCYTQIFNILDFPAGTIRVTAATREDEQAMGSWPAGGGQKDPVERVVHETMAGIAGMPVSVQCVALPGRDETCLRLMREVECQAALSIPIR